MKWGEGGSDCARSEMSIVASRVQSRIISVRMSNGLEIYL